MKKIILILALLFCSVISYSQELNLIHQDDNIKIKKIEGDDFSVRRFYSCDESLWFTINNSNKDIYKVMILNDYGDFTREININPKNIPILLSGTNLYFLKYKYTEISTQSIIIDTLIIECYDTLGTFKFSKVLPRTNDDTVVLWGSASGNTSTIILENKEFINITTGNKSINNSYTAPYFRIIKFDTLGNLLKSKIFYEPINEYHINEMGEYLMFSKSVNFSGDSLFKLYYLNKETLEIEDSISKVFIGYKRKINDSLMFVSAIFLRTPPIYSDTIDDLFIMNIRTKEFKPITFFPIQGAFGELGKDKNVDYLDFTNPDSVYLVYNVRSGSGMNYDFSGNIEIVNFNSTTRDTNYVYRMVYDTNTGKQIQGIKATKDGGLIILMYSFTNGSPSILYSWIVKFMPNGFVGLTNIETNEKESIRVYPNPAKDYIYVDIEAERFSSSEIELFDIQGRMVKKSKLNDQIGNRIDVSTLPSGAYNYRVVINGKGISGKVIIGE
ncbi:MAG: T9SS type A sorting domain-containing protein [Bacteroidales bacterium]